MLGAIRPGRQNPITAGLHNVKPPANHRSKSFLGNIFSVWTITTSVDLHRADDSEQSSEINEEHWHVYWTLSEPLIKRTFSSQWWQCLQHIHLLVAARHNINIVRHKLIFYLWSCASSSITQTAYCSIDTPPPHHNEFTLSLDDHWRPVKSHHSPAALMGEEECMDVRRFGYMDVVKQSGFRNEVLRPEKGAKGRRNS